MRGEGGGEQEPGRGEGGGVPAAPGVAPLIVELEDRSSGDSAQQGDVSKSLKRVMAGGMAGMLAKTIVAPVDRVKILFQVTNEKFSPSHALSLARKILKVEGITGLWKGNSATMLRVFPYAGSQFFIFDAMKKRILLRKKRAREGEAGFIRRLTGGGKNLYGLSTAEGLMCGSVAGAVSAFLTYPLDLARARLAVEIALKGAGNHHIRRGPISVLRQLVREEGLASLYRGVVPTLGGIVPYSGIAFTINDICKHEVRVYTGKEPEMYHQLAIGAVAGLVAQSSTYPLEVIRRRMQTSGVIDQHGTAQGVFVKEGHQPLPREKPTISHILSEVMREQGVRGLFKGLSMNWVKGPIAISVSFTTFDLLKKKFGV